MTMDLHDFDTRQKAEAGVEFPLILKGVRADGGDVEVTGSDGKPVMVRVRGLHAIAVSETYRRFLAGKFETTEEEVAAEMEMVRAAVAGWSDNLVHKGKAVKFSPKAVEDVFSVPAARSFVVAKVFETKAFMNGS